MVGEFMNKEALILEALNSVEKISMIMREYDTRQHVYAKNKLYQTEAHMLEQIGNCPGINASQLAVIFSKTVSACSQIIKKLLQKGFITQNHMQGNARVHKLYLTETGKKIYNDHHRLENWCFRRKVEEFENISTQEIEVFLKICGIFNKSFQLDLGEEGKKLKQHNEAQRKTKGA